MFELYTLLAAIFFLGGTFVLTAFLNALRQIHHKDLKKIFKKLGKFFFYKDFHQFFLPPKEDDGLFLAAVCAQSLTRFAYTACALLLVFGSEIFQGDLFSLTLFSTNVWFVIALALVAIIAFIIADFLPRLIGAAKPETVIRICGPLSTPFLFAAFPLTYFVLKFAQLFIHSFDFDHYHRPKSQAKQEILDLIEEAHLSPTLDKHEKKLIESVLSFKERIAREVMVPRVDVFSLPAETTIKDAAAQIEGYSRTPIYRNTVDNIVGVLMYKDVLNKFIEFEKTQNMKVLLEPIESIQKSVLYTPETKKISALLQEFRKKQVHLAIVVDEYGGTEGIVTIEDILEEIVGDIADEYDDDESLFKRQPDGSWIVDGKMNIIDIEDELDIKIPQEGEYDSIGGYIFHCTGSIPTKGFVIHQTDFELEVLQSNERSVEKVKIKPAYPHDHINDNSLSDISSD